MRTRTRQRAVHIAERQEHTHRPERGAVESDGDVDLRVGVVGLLVELGQGHASGQQRQRVVATAPRHPLRPAALAASHTRRQHLWSSKQENITAEMGADLADVASDAPDTLVASKGLVLAERQQAELLPRLVHRTRAPGPRE
eukprot:1052295-Rhodomonas_salina.1